MNKITFFIIISIMSICSLKLKSQENLAMIDLSKNYEVGTSNDNYFQIFQLPGNFTQKQIEQFKINSLKYNHVLDVIINKSSDTYSVKLLLDKATENISGYFRDYLLNVSINQLIVDGKKINTVDYYTYLSQKLNHQEVSKKNELSK